LQQEMCNVFWLPQSCQFY